MLSYVRLTQSIETLLDSNAETFVVGYDRAVSSASYSSVLFGIGTPSFMAGMSVGSSPLAIAEYSYRLFIRILDRTIVLSTQSVARGDPGALTLRYVAGNITAEWYESIYGDWEVRAFVCMCFCRLWVFVSFACVTCARVTRVRARVHRILSQTAIAACAVGCRSWWGTRTRGPRCCGTGALPASI